MGVWGHSPTAPRGQAIAARRGAAVVRVEDAFLRSLFPGRSGSPALGLVIDHGGMHYAPDSGPDLLQILAKHSLDYAALLTRARHAMARLQAAHLTKYSATLTDGPDLPAPGYVLVIDQTRGDAAITMGGATAQSFANMLAAARTDHPHHRIIIKTIQKPPKAIGPAISGPKTLTHAPLFWPRRLALGHCLRGLWRFTPCPRKWGSKRSWQAIARMFLAPPFTPAGA